MQLRELQLIKEYSGTVYFGDCLHVMQDLTADSVDLIVTSPPYANMRAHTYGGIDHDLYVPWFCERAEQMLRILKPTGSLVVNIKEDVVDGERHLYVYELILALRNELGFRFIDEYIWHKSNPAPGLRKYRMVDAFERLLHFSLQTELKINREAVKVPARSTKYLNRTPTEKDMVVRYRSTGSGHSTREANFFGRTHVYPSNVLHKPVICYGTGHSAAYSEWIPEFFIKLFTDAGDTVLDPFLGSGTTYRVAKRLGRRPLGVENLHSDTQMDLGDEDVEIIYRDGQNKHLNRAQASR